MSSKQASTRGGATETSPLLGNNSESAVADHQNAAETGQNDDADHEGDVPSTEERSGLKLFLIFASVWLGVFLNALDSTIVATLSNPISNSFDSQKLFSWVASSYLIANAGFQPISGKLTDIYGRRAGLVFANIFFASGNLICGLARSEWVIIFGRVIAGIGGGCLNTVSTFIITDIIPLRSRGLWQGVGNICFGVGAGVGGLIGGAINDALDWRWAFLIQVPLSALSCIIVIFVVNIPVKQTDENRIKRVDFLGSFTLVASLVLLCLGLNSGGNIVPWNHPLVYVSIPLALVVLIGFVYIEDKVAVEPVIPVRLLLKRTVASACSTNWLTTMAYYSYLFYGQVYFESAKGFSTTQAGLRLVPNAIGLAVGSLGSGVLMRMTGTYYWLNVGIEAVFVLSTALMVAFLNLHTPDWPPFIIFLLSGAGYGSMLTITLLALISAVEHKHQAVITSASYAARSTGSTIGIAISSAVFQNLLNVRLQEEFKGVKHAAKIISRVREKTEYIRMLSPDLQSKALRALQAALQGVWWTTFGLALLGALGSLFMKQHTLYSNLSRRDSTQGTSS